MIEANAQGVYICMTKGCKKYNTEVEHPFHADWPLATRQHKCKGCKKRMLLYRIKRVMTEAAKAKLVALNARRKEKV